MRMRSTPSPRAASLSPASSRLGTGNPTDSTSFFAVTLGMTFQVSDAIIEDRHIRRTALVQAVLSFAFNVFVLAITINVLGSAL